MSPRSINLSPHGYPLVFPMETYKCPVQFYILSKRVHSSGDFQNALCLISVEKSKWADKWQINTTITLILWFLFIIAHASNKLGAGWKGNALSALAKRRIPVGKSKESLGIATDRPTLDFQIPIHFETYLWLIRWKCLISELYKREMALYMCLSNI